MFLVVITKTPNTSSFSEGSVSKIVIDRGQIEKSGATDVIDVLNYIDGIDLKQNGQRGQLTSLFMRGTNSNHTLVLLNGIAIMINQQLKVFIILDKILFKPYSKLKFTKDRELLGPSAIGSAINFVTAIDYVNKFSISGHNSKNNSIDTNYTKITDNGWHLNFKGSNSNNKTNSARYGGKEDDSAKIIK